MKLSALDLTLCSSQPLPNRPDHLRGYIGSTYRTQTVLHQHEDTSTIYRYPRVRYLILQGKAHIIGYNEGVEALQSIYPSLKMVILGQDPYPIYEKEVCLSEEEFNIFDTPLEYRFRTPWLALSQENYARYRGASEEERHQFLERILIGNILSAAKGFDYTVNGEITVKLKRLRPTECLLKDIPVTGFYGSFTVNFQLPPLFGLGKSVSRGYGAVSREDD